MFGLEGKNLLVLGGGLGMGESTCLMLASVGANVAVADVEPDRAERVASAVIDSGVRAVPIAVDVTDDGAVADAIARTERELGALHGMAAIVGMAGWAPILEMTPEMWDVDHRRNLRYFFVAAREVAGAIMRRGDHGSLVCVASIDGIRSAPFHASYGAAKAGLLNLVKSMSVEWAQHGVRVNAVAPGAMVTPRFPDRGADEEREMMRTVPMQRRGTTDDIAKAVLFFLSELSAYVTGQTLAVDGGYTAVGPLDYSAQAARATPGGTVES